jgi:mRNA interferase MazF
MPIFRQRDVVRVPFPYTDRFTDEHRPAVVISHGALGNGGFLLWVAMVTATTSRRWPGDIEVSDLRLAGLPAPSVVRTLKIATIEAARAALLGRLDDTTWHLVAEQLQANLAL